MTRSELKKLAITSAIAAAGGAVATTIVSAVVERYFSGDQDTGPTFVVVPVVDRPVPALPPPEGGQVAGLGALSPARRKAAHAALPPCYTEQFDACLQEDMRNHPACARYEPVLQAYEHDHAETEALVDAMRYCDHAQREMVRNVAAAAGGGLLAGVLLTAVLRG